MLQGLNMIVIYHVPGTRGFRAIWTCEELGLDYEVKAVDFSPEFRASPEWRKINPVGKVPAMTDGNLLMFESGAMVQYLLDKYGDGRLQPKAGSDSHALYLQWSWFAEATFSRPLGEIVNHGREFPGDKRIPEVTQEMANRAALCANAVADEMTAKNFLVDNEFSGADIMMGYTLMLMKNLAGDQFPAHLEDYWQRLSQRPGFQVASNA